MCEMIDYVVSDIRKNFKKQARFNRYALILTMMTMGCVYINHLRIEALTKELEGERECND